MSFLYLIFSPFHYFLSRCFLITFLNVFPFGVTFNFFLIKDETMGRLQLLQEKELRLAGCSRDCNKRSKAVLQAMGL